MSSTPDPVIARRARVARGVTVGRRVGYAALLGAMVAFVAGVSSDFPGWLVTTTVVLLVAAIVVLPVPIVLGYGVKAAEREEHRAARPGTPG